MQSQQDRLLSSAEDDRKSQGGTANARHIKTEQKRRDRINDGFLTLGALLPSREKVEKASMLTQAAGYIRQLQELMQQLMDSGSVSALPSELQLRLRLLLPRKPDQAAAPAVPAAPSNLYTAAAAAPTPKPQAPSAALSTAPLAGAPALPGMDMALMSQMQYLAVMALATQTSTGISQTFPAAPSRAAARPASSTLVMPKASTAHGCGLESLVQAASLAQEAEGPHSRLLFRPGGEAFKAANKEHNPRKRGRELTENIAPPQKQARCYTAGPKVDLMAMPHFDFVI